VLEKFFNSLTKKTEPPVAPASRPAQATVSPPSVAAPAAQPVRPPASPSTASPPVAIKKEDPIPTPAPVPAPKPVFPATPVSNRTADISLYKNLLAGLYDGILIFDEKGAVIGSNQRAEQYLGYSGQELWGMQCEELVVGINARLLYKLRANAESGRFTIVNGNCKRKDGATFPAEIAISRIHLLNNGDFIFTIHNVERREKVRDQRELSHEAIRSAGAGIVVCNQEGTIEFVNPAFLKILNVDSEQAVVKRLIGDFCNSYETIFAMLHAPSTQGTWLGSLKLTTSKGGTCDVLVTSSLSQERRGAEARLVLTMTPIPKSIA
jgi:PAS domain S-box-containing protein